LHKIDFIARRGVFLGAFVEAVMTDLLSQRFTRVLLRSKEVEIYEYVLKFLSTYNCKHTARCTYCVFHILDERMSCKPHYASCPSVCSSVCPVAAPNY